MIHHKWQLEPQIGYFQIHVDRYNQAIWTLLCTSRHIYIALKDRCKKKLRLGHFDHIWAIIMPKMAILGIVEG